MKAFAIAVLAVLGLLSILAHFVPGLLMSVSAFWLVFGLLAFGYFVGKACKG